MNDDEFREWYHGGMASPEEQRLHDRLYDFEEYFSDMVFNPESIVSGVLQCQEKMDNGNCQDSFIGQPAELHDFCYNRIKTKVEPSLKNIGGYFNKKELTLCVSEENLEKDSVILHEMIHMYEFVLNQQPLFYHDTLFWVLYNDLQKKIEKLDEIVSGHAHILVEQSIYNQGGLHDILFLLKSLDLDIQMGYPLGRVFGYDMENLLKEYTYRSDV